MKKKIDHLTEEQLETLWRELLGRFPLKPTLLGLLAGSVNFPTLDELVTDDVWNQAVVAVEGKV